MIQDDSTYFAKRAEAELEQARRATVPAVAQVHHQLAQAYLERLKPDIHPSSERAV